MKRARTQHGLSLVEATIILMSLMVLGGVLAPSIMDYVDDAKMVKVKEDCEAIGLSIARLLRDVGPCIKMDARLPCTIYNRADLLISEGHDVEGYSGRGQTAFNATGSAGYTGASYETTTDCVNYVTEYVPRGEPAGITWTDATRLGGSTSFSAPLTSPDDLKRMVVTQGLAADVRGVLRASGLSEAADGVIATLQSASSAETMPMTSLEACSRVAPPLGSVVECRLEVGEKLSWMAYRPGAPKGDRSPGRLQNVRWAGKAPVRSFAFRVENAKEAYTFVVPALCGNLSLMSVADIRQREVNCGSTTTSHVARSTSRRSYGTSPIAYASSSAVSTNVNTAIGWYHTPLRAGLRFGHPNVDYLENQLIRNWPAGMPINHYAVPTQRDALIPGPRFNLGWRGAYLSAPIGDDPWGHRYFVNTMFLFAFGGNPAAEGYSAWASDTFCLSAGRNGWIETPFASYGYPVADYAGFTGGTVRGGDDFVYVIAGGSR